MTPIAPGSTIGILGGGQLGRMLSIAAASLGYRTHIYAPEASGPAADVSARWIRGSYEDAKALAAFARDVDVVTYEFENVPVGAVATIETIVPVRPGRASLDVAQDRLTEKNFAVANGGKPAPFAAVDSAEGLADAIAAIGVPAILKTRRLGYDGKGQARIHAAGDAAAAWDAIGGQPAIFEGFVRFEQEFSVIVVRGQDGTMRHWDVPENIHKDGVLDRSIVPAPGRITRQSGEAVALAERIATVLDHVGVLAVEFFAGREGPVFNEMAPRVHNSGHWSIEGAVTSQFENHIRAICGLPLGDTALAARHVEMRNLIGDDAETWPALMAEPGLHVHLYGKGAGRPGRKMGHVTRLAG
jgi:5-(carboxyamino)imidazole ribonucleotide synthase